VPRNLVLFLKTSSQFLKILGAIKINNCWRRRHNDELMQLNGDLDLVSFMRINRLRWIGHVNRMDNKRMVYQVFANQPRGSRPRGTVCMVIQESARSKLGTEVDK
jgi:hypothetical protein